MGTPSLLLGGPRDSRPRSIRKDCPTLGKSLSLKVSEPLGIHAGHQPFCLVKGGMAWSGGPQP